MKNILLASACALLMSSNAFAQAAKTATQAGAEAFGGAAASAGRTAAPVAGRPATPRAPEVRTGRTARTSEARTTRTAPTGASLNTAAANAAGVSVTGKRTPAPTLAPVATAAQPTLAQPTRTASAPAATVFAPSCTASQMAKVTTGLQAAIRGSTKFSNVNCGETISPAAQAVAVKVIQAVEAAPAANDAAELTAAQKEIETARSGIAARDARAAAAQVMCSTASHQACVAVKPSTGICQLAQREGLLN